MKPLPIESVCIIGAGILGTQVGLHCAVHGYAVSYFDSQQAALKRAAEHHRQELKRRVDARQITLEEMATVLGRIRFAADMDEAMSGAQLVIEAISE